MILAWARSWNKIIREIIWPDNDLKTFMKIPSKTGILQFTERYFIRAGYTNRLLTDEVCRIVYADSTGIETDVPNITKNTMFFDIYVKQDEMYNIGNDRLLSRLDYIADRLDKLLTQSRYLADTAYRFWPAEGELDLGTRTQGYSRRTLAYHYMKVY